MKPLAEEKSGASLYVALTTSEAGSKKMVAPLENSPELYLIFVRSVSAPENVLEFVQRYGPLTLDGYDPARGDNVDLVLLQARSMLAMVQAAEARNPKVGFRIPIMAGVHFDPKTAHYRWRMEPRTLLDGLWLQLGQAVTRGVEIAQCKHCGSWFECGGGTGRRVGAMFCSEEHKIAFHSLKRSRE
jgi:hypothetical protein